MSALQSARNWKILILGPSAKSAGAARTLLAQEMPAAQVFEIRSYPESAALPQLFAGQPLSLCLLDAATSRDTAIALIKEIQRLAPRVAVVAMLEENDPNAVLSCLRGGASEFLIHPFAAAQLEQVAAKLTQAFPELAASAGHARAIAVLPAKGGCGASTLALNLAYQKKRFNAKRVLLADLDPLCGTLAFQMKAKPSYTFMDALQRAHQLDADVWRGLVQTADGLDVLHAPDTLVEGIYEPPDPAAMIEFARSLYDLAVLDCGSAYGPWNTRLAQLADDVVLVASTDAAAVRSAKRALDSLTARHVPLSRIKLVANREPKGSEPERLAVAVGIPVTQIVPADPETVHTALIEGKAAAAGTPFAKAVAQLATALAGTPAEKPAEKSPAKASGIANLFGLLRRA
jgi:pilus assembly protein CpaE